MKGGTPNSTVAILPSQPKHYTVAFHDWACKLRSDNVRLIARMKGEDQVASLYSPNVKGSVRTWLLTPGWLGECKANS